MKKLLALLLSAVILLTTIFVAIPLSATANTEAIEATPFVFKEVANGDSATLTFSEVTPTAFTSAKGTRITLNPGKDFYSVDSDGRGKYTASFTLTDGTKITSDETHFMFRFEANGPSSFCFRIDWAGSWLYLNSGATVEVLKDGAKEWETKTITAGSRPQIQFDEAFSGYIKLKYTDSSIIPASEREITNIHLYTYGMGTVGENTYATEMTVGPFFTITSDSTSTVINVPDEFKLHPIEATPFTFKEVVNGDSATITLSEVTPAAFTSAKGTHIALNSGKDFYSVDGDGRGKYIASFTPADGTKITSGETHFMFRYETNGPSSICFRLDWAGSWLYLSSGATVEVLKDGATGWETKRATVGTRPQIQFDEAFSGYIKFAYSDSSIIPASERDITNIHLYSYGMGTYGEHTYATEMTVGPLFTVTSNSASTVINVPDEFKPQPIEAVPFSFKEISNGDNNAVSFAEVKPCDFTSATGTRIILNSGKDFYSVDNDGRGKYIASFTPADGTKITSGETHLMFRYEANDASSICFRFDWAGSWLYLSNGATVEILKDGAKEWETKITTAGTRPQIQFDEAFSGYIKFKYTEASIIPSSERDITNIHLYSYGMGTVGEHTYATEMMVGPFFTVTKDSSSAEINVPNEWRPRPIDATPLEYSYNNGAINAYVTDASVKPFDWTDAVGRHLTLNSGADFEKTDNKVAVGARGIFNFTDKTVAENETYFIFNLQTNDKIIFSPVFTSLGGYPFTLRKNSTVQILKDGETNWESLTIVATADDGGAEFGGYAIKLDEAFSGLIKIAYKDIGHDENGKGYINSNEEKSPYPLTQFLFYPKAMGTVGENTYATEFTVGPFFTSDEPLPPSEDDEEEEPDTPDEFKPETYDGTAIVIDNIATGDAVTAVDVSPLSDASLIGKRIKLKTGKDFYSVNDQGRGTNGFRFNLSENSVVGQDDTYFILYFKTNGPATFSPMLVVSNSWYNLKSGATVKILKNGETEWQTLNTSDTAKPQIQFAEEFSGYIKIAYSDFDNGGVPTNIERPITRIDFYTYGMGTVGENTYATEFTVGPFFTSDEPLPPSEDDEEEEPDTPDEFKPETYDGTAIVIDNIATGDAVTAVDVSPLSDASLIGKRIKLKSGKDFYSVNDQGRGTNGFRFDIAANAVVAEDDTYFIFYFKTNGPATFSPMLVVSNSWYNLKNGAVVQILKNGETEWQTLNTSDTAKPQIQFAEEFSGYIKIAYSDFDNGGVPTNIERPITRIDFYTYGMGTVGENTYATEFTVGPFFTSDEPLPPSEDDEEEDDETKSDVIEAVPFLFKEVINGDNTMLSFAEVKPSLFTSATGTRITLNSGKDFYSVDSDGRGKYIASFTPKDGTNIISGESHFMFRFEANGPSSFCFRLDWANSWLYLNSGATIEILRDGANEWETMSTTAGTRPQIQFDKPFSGYIKFKYLDSGIVPSLERNITNIHLYTYGMGAVGEHTYATEMTVGPFFTVTSDSTSTEINVPDEFKARPINATQLEYSYLNAAISSYATVSDVKPLDWTSGSGKHLTLITGADFEKADDKVAIGARGIFNFKDITVAEDDTYFIFYLKTNGKLTFAPVFSSLGGYPFALRKNCTVQILKDGETNWESLTTVATGDDSGSDFGGYAIKLDEAFSGLIKIAYNDIGHDEIGKGYINSNKESTPYPLTQFLFYPKAMGKVGKNAYATEFVVGPFFTSDEPLPPVEMGEIPPSLVGTVPLEYSYNNGAINTYTSDLSVKPFEWTDAVGRRLTLKAGTNFEKAGDKVAIGARGIFNFKDITISEDETYFIFNLQTNDKLIFAPVFSSLGGYPFALRRNCTVQILKDGETKWETLTTVATGDDGGAEFGGYAIRLDEAFSGLVKIAYKDIGHDEIGKGYINFNEGSIPYPLTQFLFYPKAMGKVGKNTCATEITVGPFFTSKQPLNDSDDANKPKPIEATPFEFKEVINGDKSAVSLDEVVSSAVTSVKGTRIRLNTGKDFYSVDSDGRGKHIATFTPQDGTKITSNETHFMFRYEANGPSSICLRIDWANSWLYLNSGATIEVLKDGAAEWETMSVTKGTRSQIQFDKAFSGYIKFRYLDSGIIPNSEREITNIHLYTYGMGTAGKKAYASVMTVGPFFTVTSDSESIEIKVPDEFKRIPIDATLLEYSYLHAAISQYTTVGSVKPLDWTDALGRRLTLMSGADFEKADDKVAVGARGIFNFKDITVAEDDTHFIFYFSSNDKTVFTPVFSSLGGYPFALRRNATVEVLKDGETKWRKIATVSTGDSGGTEFGGYAIKFDEAFSGFIKIAYKDIGHDEIGKGYINSNEEKRPYPLTQFLFYPKAMGRVEKNTYATDITVGPFFTASEPELPPPAADSYVEPRPNGPAEKYLNQLSATLIEAHIEPDTQGIIERRAVYPLADLPSAIGCQLVPIKSNSYEVAEADISSSEAKAVYLVNSPIGGKGSVLVYVKAYAGNMFLPQIEIKNPSDTNRWDSDINPYMSFAVGDEYEYLSAEFEKWQRGVTVEGVEGSSSFGAIYFETDFEGYIKLPFEALVNDNGFTVDVEKDGILRLIYSFKGVGGKYGQAIAGPSFFIKDGESADRVVTVPEGATVVDTKPSLRATLNLSAQPDYVRAGKSVVQGYRIKGTTEITGRLPFSYAGIFLLDLNNKYTDSNYLTFYIDLPGPNKLGIGVNKEDGNDSTFKAGREYEVLADGSTEWVTKISTEGKEDGDKNYGSLEFDSAFKGWVRLPYTSFFDPPKQESQFGIFRINFSEIGGDYGEVVFGPFATMFKTPYIAPNVWDKSKLPEMTPFDPATEVMGYSYYGISIEEVPSPIPTLSSNKGFYVSCSPSISLDTVDLLKSPYTAYQKYNDMPFGEITHIMFYVKVPESRDNELTMSLWTDTLEFKIIDNALYSLLPLGSYEWQHYYTKDPIVYNWGTFALPAGFEGFLKVPIVNLQPNAANANTKLQSIGYRFAYIGEGSERPLVGPVFGVTKDNDPGPEDVVLTSLPTPTTILRPYEIEPGDIFPDKVMLSWQPYENAKEYVVDAYLVQKGEEGKTYKLVKSVKAFTNSATITGLEKETQYALVVNAYDADKKLIATYAHILVTTTKESMYAPLKFGGGRPSDGVLYPSGVVSDNNEGYMQPWLIVVICATTALVLAGGVFVTIVVLKKRRKTNA